MLINGAKPRALAALVALTICVVVVEREPIARAGFAPEHYVCVARYKTMDPIADAKVEARKTIPRFYYHEFGGVGEGTKGTGIGCDPDRLGAPNDPTWKKIDQYHSVVAGDDGPGPTKIMTTCDDAAQSYAGRFNHKLAELRPDGLARACDAQKQMTLASSRPHYVPGVVVTKSNSPDLYLTATVTETSGRVGTGFTYQLYIAQN